MTGPYTNTRSYCKYGHPGDGGAAAGTYTVSIRWKVNATNGGTLSERV